MIAEHERPTSTGYRSGALVAIRERQVSARIHGTSSSGQAIVSGALSVRSRQIPFDPARLRSLLRSSAGRRKLADAVLVRLNQGLRARLLASMPMEHLEDVTNVRNLVTRQAVRVVASLGIPDLIAAGITDLDALAVHVGADGDAFRRLSRHLVNRGVFTAPTSSTLGLTAVGELLRSGEKNGRHLYFQVTGVAPRFEAALAGMMHSVLTGEPAYAHIHGEELWQQLEKEPLLAASFDADMNIHAREVGPVLAQHYDWTGVTRVADVGGGSGELLRSLLTHLPAMTGTVIEFADVARRARKAMDDAGFASRCDVVEADFLERVPAVADAYLLSWILHDWKDEQAVTILRHCRAAAGSDGRVLVIEQSYDLVADSGLDLRMLVFFGARERTRQEYEMLAKAAGLRVVSWTPLVSDFSVMDCRPVG
jgi:2,7-dihydroxy-5-methyl-1-naphthoate 7-O-methyltransferase